MKFDKNGEYAPATGIAIEGHFEWLLSRIKLYYSLFGNTPSKKLNHTKTSQLICFANHLTGFYTTQASTEGISKKTLMGHAKV